MKKRLWKLGEEGADYIVELNIKALQVISEELENCCANPFCKIPLSDDREAHYGAPGYGEVCDVCHSMHTSLTFMNPNLKNSPNYFKDLHEAWLKEIRDFKDKRRKMGD
jgi:hypothetical protein